MRAKQRKSALVLVLMVLTLSACVQGRSGVGVRPLTADIVFGIPPLDEPVAAPDTIPRPDPLLTDDFASRPIPPGPPGDDFVCDKALFNEVEKPAENYLTGQVEAGLYHWKVTGTFDAGPPLGKIPLTDITERTIEDVRKLATSPKDYTYKLVQTETLGSIRFETTFEVITSRPNPPPITNQAYYETTSKNSLNGIYLTRFAFISGGDEFEANYNPPVLYLPLPVPIGVTFSTTTSDPDTLATFQHTGKVIDARRWDACGKLVEGWFVDGEQTFSFATFSTTRQYDYAFATQYGGNLVFEHIQAPCDDYDSEKNECKDAQIIYSANIGQLTPDTIR